MKTVHISDYRLTKLPEGEVIRRVLSGEKELYEILMRRNNQKLFRVIRGYLQDAEEIQDVMQDTYLTAYEKLWQYKHKAQFSTWLIRIGIHQALALIKKKAKVRTINPVQLTSEMEQEITDEKRPGPEKKMIRKEAKELLEKAIDSLDDKYRSIYIMREVEEMSISDIAECTDLSTSNVKVRLHRAKGMIKENLYALSYTHELFEFGFSKCDRLVERVMEQV